MLSHFVSVNQAYPGTLTASRYHQQPSRQWYPENRDVAHKPLHGWLHGKGAKIPTELLSQSYSVVALPSSPGPLQDTVERVNVSVHAIFISLFS